MICIETQHFNLNRTLLLAIGLWPYQKSKLVQFQTILFFSILISFVIFQLTAFITTICTVDFIIETFSTALVFNFYVIIYNMFWINTHHVRNLLEQLQYICNELRDKNELAIIKKYGYYTRRFTAIFTLLGICTIFFLILLPIWPHVFGTLLHINKSRIENQAIQITNEYFIDQEKYFYLILLHKNAVFCIGITTLTATGTTLLGCVIHICGMFKIASYRIEEAMSTKMLKNINLKNQTMIYKKIFYAVEIHRKTIKFTDMLISSFEGSFLLLIMFFVISLSLNTFAVFRNASLGNKEVFLFHLLYVFTIYLDMFLYNYAGQEITNYSNHVYFTAYNVRWYLAPLGVQKMILFILQNGSKTFHLNIAGLFVISIECFATLIKASMSYFTFMYSVQQ
ncbi:odorant receptor 4-like [Cataglyphis hispanica]|uniref:odorant receptor 4-like n=1 Tax=Cataglyphis hispanica TaxID=1086592 RepID=UPI00217F7303|nr:odorant receptor 4-like [Cataglyphis hispanica]